jgi:hypothetical protein
MFATGSLVLGLALTAAQPAGMPPRLPSDNEVRRLLKAGDNFDDGPRILEEHGSSLFPAYSRLIKSNDLSPEQLGWVFTVVAKVKADRSQFLETAVAALAHKDVEVRRSSLYLLAQIGSARDATPVAALLGDRETLVVYGAAETLSAIGDRRALTALEVWQVTGPGRDVPELRVAIAGFRETLSRRLDAALPVAPPPRPIQR